MRHCETSGQFAVSSSTSRIGDFSSHRHSKLCFAAMAMLAMAGAATMPRQAVASLQIDLQFLDGSHTMAVTAANAGQQIPVNVYAKVTGANPVTTQTSSTGATTTNTTPQLTVGNFDGLQYVYFDILSGVPSGTPVPGNIAAPSTGFGPAMNGVLGFNANGSYVGPVQDNNGDGIADLGSSFFGTNSNKARAASAVFNNYTIPVVGTDTYVHVGSPNIIVSGSTGNSVSFLLETVYYTIGADVVGNEATTLNPSIPGNLPPAYYGANWFEDNTAITAPPQSTLNGSYVPGTSVLFFSGTIVPEPTTLSAAILGTGLLLGRRRKTVHK